MLPRLLLSLPPNMVEHLGVCEPRTAANAHWTHDPPGRQLGSGGGTAHLLVDAWRKSGIESFDEWLNGGCRIVLHGGGESRRLPAYAGAGKLFLPLPALRWEYGQRLDQTLLDMQQPFLERVMERAGASTRILLASGDVVLRAEGPMPELPDADVVLLGMWTQPEEAQNFGVLFTDRRAPEELRTFLQKPTPDRIRELSRDYAFLIDVGVWLLSERAVRCLLTKCGFDASSGRFTTEDGHPSSYDLYGTWALHLGTEAVTPDDDVRDLRVAVAPLRDGQFYHFGTSGDMIDSMFALQNLVLDQTRLGPVPSLAQPRQFIQNSNFEVPVRREENYSLWVENSCVPAGWTLNHRHVITGVPDNDWQLTLPAGVCLDFVPLAGRRHAIRIYGFADASRGPIGDPATRWIEAPAPDWFAKRGISWEEAELDPAGDLQLSAIFPVVDDAGGAGDLVRWMIDPAMSESPDDCRRHWIEATRLSARHLAQQVDLPALYEARTRRRRDALPLMASHGSNSLFYKIDLGWAAQEWMAAAAPLPKQVHSDGIIDPLLAVHETMFRAQVLRDRKDPAWEQEEGSAFGLLAEAIVSPLRRMPVRPAFTTLKDQIVWGRSPARIDLAGGWTDTPPYCMEHGGSVVNMAVNLNGQPPVQVFARRSENPTLTIRSIDLGVSEEITTYEALAACRARTSGFAVARAALALAGFHSDFNGGVYASLEDQLRDMGGGIDISLLAAIPKGSGLGTSSILAGTLLSVLSDLCGLGWDLSATCDRVTALEQLLGSGGGWQDQYGGLLSGIKMVETRPGLRQLPAVRWLPPNIVSDDPARWLLYYTGIKRVAHDVLGEIVRGMFLNAQSRLDILRGIARNSTRCFDAIQRNNFDALADSINESWALNQALDSGTNPPEVSAAVDQVAGISRGLKLTGAGGGGYLLILAEDANAAAIIRDRLEANPPNDGARFVELSLSTTGLQITRS